MKTYLTILIIAIFVAGACQASPKRTKYRSLSPEELAMRFRFSNHYEAMEDHDEDIRDLALDELIRRKLLHKGSSNADIIFYLGDPLHAPEIDRPYDSLAYFEYGSMLGSITIEFKDNKLSRIIQTSEGMPEDVHEHILLK